MYPRRNPSVGWRLIEGSFDRSLKSLDMIQRVLAEHVMRRVAILAPAPAVKMRYSGGNFHAVGSIYYQCADRVGAEIDSDNASFFHRKSPGAKC